MSTYRDQSQTQAQAQQLKNQTQAQAQQLKSQTQAQSQQIKQNFLNHPYTQQASRFANGQVSALDQEVCKAPNY